MLFRMTALLIFTILASCTQSGSLASASARADKICECYQPIHDFELASREAMKKGDAHGLETLSLAYPDIKSVEENCISKWEEMKRKFSEQEITGILELLKIKCYDTSIRIQAAD